MDSRTDAVGIDIGATKVAIGRVGALSGLLNITFAPLAGRSPEEVIERAADVVREWDLEPSAVGIGVAGWVDADRGMLRAAPLLGWTDIPLGQIARAHWPVPVTVDNDGTCAAWAEASAWAGTHDTLVALTLGSDVGGGIVLDGNPARGSTFRGGELGHVLIDPGGQPCVCGLRGCLATVASGRAIGRRYAELAGKPTPSGPTGIAAAVADADRHALAVLDEVADAIAVAMHSIGAVLDPGILVLGGGVAGLGEPLRVRVERAVIAHGGRTLIGTNPRVELALHGNSAGVVGAALLARRSVAHPQEVGS